MTIDFETRSRVDLKKCGASVYARHASTSILCLAYGRRRDDVQLWRPGMPKPESLLDAITWGEKIEAHNVGFERQIWYWICHTQFGWPDVPFDNWRCTMARCSRVALPRNLEDAGNALNLSIKKDIEGHKLMLRVSKPKKPTKKDPSEWDDTPWKHERVASYCVQDVQSELEIDSTIPELPKAELKLWQLDQRINLRGLQIDTTAVKHAIAVVEQSYKSSCEELSNATDGKISSPKQVAAIRKFILDTCGDDVPNLSKDTVDTWLSKDSLNPVTKNILEIRQKSSQASTAKLTAMLDRCDKDNRVRGNLVYHGAATGRWAGSGIQVQNYPRGTLSPEEIELVHRVLPNENGGMLELLFGSPMECVSSSLRSMICAAPGKRLLACDFASIEARVLAWLAGQADLLETFAKDGDVYKGMAAKIYKVEESEISKAQRQIGKIAILGLGYGMGHAAFKETCRVQAKVVIEKKFAKLVVKTYREANPNIKKLWSDLNSAAIKTIEARQPHRVGLLEFSYDGVWLRIKLPSGRDLHYRHPEIIKVRAPWSEGYVGSIYERPFSQEQLEDLDIELGSKDGCWWTGCKIPKVVYKTLKARGFNIEARPMDPEYIKQIQHWGVDSTTKKWAKIRTYGGKLCLAAGTPVLTHTGWKPIESVSLADLLWDGIEWVSHDGLIYQGDKEVISAWGVDMTPDHQCLTTNGWKDASQLYRFNKAEVRIPNGFGVRGDKWEKESLESTLHLRQNVREAVQRTDKEERFEESFLRVSVQKAAITKTKNAWYEQTPSVCSLAINARSMQITDSSSLSQLRRSWNFGLSALADVQKLLGRHGSNLQRGLNAGSNRQQRRVLQRELPLGIYGSPSQQSSQFCESSRDDTCRDQKEIRDQQYNDSESNEAGLAGRSAIEKTGRSKPCYDLLNAGPRHRFTVLGDAPFLSHNCENIVQATARDFLAEAMIRVEDAGYPIVATVHDEILSEREIGQGSLEEFESLMRIVPRWGKGCPIAVEGFEAARYRK